MRYFVWKKTVKHPNQIFTRTQDEILTFEIISSFMGEDFIEVFFKEEGVRCWYENKEWKTESCDYFSLNNPKEHIFKKHVFIKGVM